MDKMHLLAILATFLLSVMSQATAETPENQFDALKNQFLPAEYKNHNITVDKVKKIVREKCKKASGDVESSKSYEELEKGVAILTTCLGDVANLTALQEEIQDARPIGELDTVFTKYCDKVPIAVKCLQDFNIKLQPCLSVKERQQSIVLMRIATGLLDFMCMHGGDHIALFVAEEGPECLEANRDAINSCLNSSFHNSLPKDLKLADLFDLPDLVLQPGHCVDLERFQSCTIHHLEQCREITPANVAESVFKFIKNETSCSEHLKLNEAYERSVLLKVGNDKGTVNVVSLMVLVLSSGFLVLLSQAINM